MNKQTKQQQQNKKQNTKTNEREKKVTFKSGGSM